MKKTIFILAFLFSGFALKTATAQLRVNVNIGVQPIWGPVGYDYAEYYYMPDIDVYYNVPRRQYIYMERGRWMFSTSVPYRYRSYNFYNGYKVVINEPRPYRNAAMYRTKYASYRGQRNQENIRNSNDSRYFENRNHPQHNKWRQENNRNNRDNGNRGNNGNNKHKD